MAKAKINDDVKIDSDFASLTEDELVIVEYLQNGAKAKQGERIKVSIEYANVLKENGWAR